MSDFAVKFYRPFTELLVEIERRGFGANREYLIQQLTAAQADLERHKEAFRMIAQSLKGTWEYSRIEIVPFCRRFACHFSVNIHNR